MISDFPLFIFTTCSGVASGAYVLALFFRAKEGEKRPLVFPLTCLVLLGVGLLGTLFHLGQPLRFLNALANPGAPIAQEAYISIIFGVVILIDVILTKVKGTAPLALRVVGAVAAAVMLVVVGNAYYACTGVPVWTNVVTFPFFIVGDLAMGAGLLALVRKGVAAQNGFAILNISVEAVLGITLVFTAVQFSSYGLSAVPFVVALILAPVVVIVLQALLAADKISEATAAKMIAAGAIIGVVIARYAFYAASTI